MWQSTAQMYHSIAFFQFLALGCFYVCFLLQTCGVYGVQSQAPQVLPCWLQSAVLSTPLVSLGQRECHTCSFPLYSFLSPSSMWGAWNSITRVPCSAAGNNLSSQSKLLWSTGSHRSGWVPAVEQRDSGLC